MHLFSALARASYGNSDARETGPQGILWMTRGILRDLPCLLASMDITPHSPWVISATSLAKHAKESPENPAPW